MSFWKMQFNVAGTSKKLECFDFEMIISNLSKLNGVANSPTFTATEICKTTWQIFVEVSMLAKKMRIGLKRTDSNTSTIKASMFYEIQNDDHEVYWRDSINHTYNGLNLRYCDYLDIPSHQQGVSGMKGEEFKLSSDTIKIQGNVLVKQQEISNQIYKMHHVLHREILQDLERDYKHLYYNQKFSDIKFQFHDGKLLAHKNVLSSRSLVFEKMFKESKFLNILIVADVEKSVFDLFLLFFYTGVVENRTMDMIMPLYRLALKYEVRNLSGICANILMSCISIETATPILELANTHSDTVLTESAIDFVCKNFSKVSQSCEWGKLLNVNPCFASIVLRRVSKSLKSNNVKLQKNSKI